MNYNYICDNISFHEAATIFGDPLAVTFNDPDPEVHTLVWPNGIDFDPMTLHDWPLYEESMKAPAKRSEEKVDA